MASNDDVSATRIVRREFNRHKVDVGMADVRVSHGVVYIRGLVKSMKGANYTDLKEEIARIGRNLRQRSEIRDVVIDCQYRDV